jgi:hypothetical protein
MTRKLILQYLQSDGEEVTESNWRKWILNETFRRTIFLVNVINILSCRTQTQNPYFFEALDDNLVHSMHIPAPEVLWTASSAEEWSAAKAALSPELIILSKSTVKSILEQIQNDSNEDVVVLHRRQETRKRSRTGNELGLHDLPEFTRLVIATINPETKEEL